MGGRLANNNQLSPMKRRLSYDDETCCHRRSDRQGLTTTLGSDVKYVDWEGRNWNGRRLLQLALFRKNMTFAGAMAELKGEGLAPADPWEFIEFSENSPITRTTKGESKIYCLGGFGGGEIHGRFWVRNPAQPQTCFPKSTE